MAFNQELIRFWNSHSINITAADIQKGDADLLTATSKRCWIENKLPYIKISEVSPIKCDVRESVVRTSDSRECVVGDSQQDDSQECVVSKSFLFPKIGEMAHFIGTG